MTANQPQPFNASTLKPFSMGGVQPFYKNQAGHSVRNSQSTLPSPRKIVRTSHAKQMLMLGNAIKHIERLPEPGEYLHCVINGSYDPWFVVPAVLRLAAPATIAHLWVATLGYNRTNILNMVQLLDAKAIARVSLICSLYFRSVERDIWDELYNGLTSRGQRVVSVRSHCKILGFEMSDGRRFLSQGSANLRSSSNLEQFVMTQDGELLAFHTAWMDDVIKGAAIE